MYQKQFPKGPAFKASVGAFCLWLGCGLILHLAIGALAQPALNIGLNFTGSSFGRESPAVPADTDGAIGPNHFVEFVNGRFAVYSRTNGSRVQSMTDLTFWARAGVTVPDSWAVTDPRTVYDPTVQRWFVIQIDFDPSGTVNTNSFLLAVSATADPTGLWRGIMVPSDPGGNLFADFPTFGLGGQGLFLAGNMFDVSGNAAGTTLLSIPKAALLSPSPSASGATWFGVMNYNTRGYVAQPAVCIDGTDGGTFLATSGLGFDPLTGDLQTNTTLVGYSVHNASSPGAATLSASTFLPVPGYTAPINPTQPDGTTDLDDGDARIGASVYEAGGIIYAVHATEINSLAVLRWYRISASSLAVLETGTISDPVLDLFYPSIAANPNGTVVIACNGSSATTFVSTYAVAGQTINGTTAFGHLVLLKSGVASYHNPGASRTSRWGDYSTTCLDPTDPNVFWTIQAYPSTRSAWSTQITQLFIGSPRPPALNLTRAGNDVQVSWPISAAGFQLESKPALNPTLAWSPVTQNLQTNGNSISVVLPLSQTQQYFRLFKPTSGLALALEPSR